MSAVSTGCGVPPRAAAPRGETSAASPERPEVGEEVVGEQDRLRPLEVRISGQDQVPVRLANLNERTHRLEQTFPYML